MLETIDARAGLREIPRHVQRDWALSRSRTSVRYSHPEPPPGISLVTVSGVCDGSIRGRVEGNLTSLLYGPDAAVGSLDLGDLEPALDRFLEVTTELIGTVPGPDRWDLHRLDPSQTFELPPGDLPLVLAGFRDTMRAAYPGDVTDHGSTVVHRLTKFLSRTLYSKTAEAKARGKWAPDGLLRAETRLRPRRARSAEWASFMPTLALTDRDLEVIVAEVENLSSLVSKTTAAGVYGLAATLRRGGASPAAALRLAAAGIIDQELPGALTDLGVPERTRRVYRSDARKYLEAAGGEAAVDEGMAVQLVRYLARAHEARQAVEGDG